MAAPSKFTLCPTCEGRGTHVNRNVDGHGITQDEMDELGPDFFEDYMSGVYDVRCETCNGLRVVPACEHPDCTAPTIVVLLGDEDEQEPFCYEHSSAERREAADDEAAYIAERNAEIAAGC